MSLAIKYEGVEDAKMRLRNTVVLYRGEPVLIKEIARGEGKDDILRVLFESLPAKGGGGGAFGRIEPEDGEQRKYISSKHFDIAPFKLGYVNHPKGVFYCTRMPNRIQKQGLCAENFSAKTNAGANVGWATFITAKESPAMIKGDYPSFDRALQLLDKVPAIAFNYDYCLVKDEVIPDLVFLYHKGKKVGYFSKNEITLGKQFKCLKESLVEMKVKVA